MVSTIVQPSEGGVGVNVEVGMDVARGVLVDVGTVAGEAGGAHVALPPVGIGVLPSPGVLDDQGVGLCQVPIGEGVAVGSGVAGRGAVRRPHPGLWLPTAWPPETLGGHVRWVGTGGGSATPTDLGGSPWRSDNTSVARSGLVGGRCSCAARGRGAAQEWSSTTGMNTWVRRGSGVV